jgi:hypothetical protein
VVVGVVSGDFGDVANLGCFLVSGLGLKTGAATRGEVYEQQPH